MLLAYDQRIKDAGGGFQRVYGRIDTEFGDLTAQYRGGIQMCKGRCRSRVRQVVCWHINCLNGSDGTFLSGSDAFLHGSHLGGQCRLVTDGGRHTSQQGGYFRTGLCEPEDIVDKEKDVFVSPSAVRSRKDSAIVSPERATEERAPGGSFIWPKTSVACDLASSS